MPSSAPRIAWTPNITLFDADAVAQQRRSNDLVIFCPILRIPVKISWPMVNGLKVPPEHLLTFLRRYHLHWSCFCTLLCRSHRSPSSIPSRIVITDKGIFVQCGFSPARCSFYMDLGAIHDSTTFSAEFVPLPDVEVDTNGELTLARYLMSAESPETANGLVHAQRFPGYWREHKKGDQPGKVCIGSPPALPPVVLPPVEPVDLPLPNPTPTLETRSASVQVDSPYPYLPPSAINVFDLHDALIFTTLGRGAGVPPDSLRGFLTLCHNCDRVFVTAVIDVHQTFCTPPARVLDPSSGSTTEAENKGEEEAKRDRAKKRASGLGMCFIQAFQARSNIHNTMNAMDYLSHLYGDNGSDDGTDTEGYEYHSRNTDLMQAHPTKCFVQQLDKDFVFVQLPSHELCSPLHLVPEDVEPFKADYPGISNEHKAGLDQDMGLIDTSTLSGTGPRFSPAQCPILTETDDPVNPAPILPCTPPPAPKICEAEGRWLCIPQLVQKRVDVVVGEKTAGRITQVQKNAKGKFGYIEVETTLTPTSLKKPITVRLGEYGTRVQIESRWLKPMRRTFHPPQVLINTCISELGGRVVVIGPDATGAHHCLGNYAEICAGACTLGPGYVRVRFPRDTPLFPEIFADYPIDSLCRSFNADGVLTQATTFI
ncbi:hypothetical protein C8R44DRAFT_736181 [Mycena epipterygia]|nr:hypothetical protein C8R44DRAFT_736181 [Mycena epipterygia]